MAVKVLQKGSALLTGINREVRLACRLAVVVAAVFGLPGAVAAQGTFALPAGCTAYVTVQKADCSVSHLFRCEADPEGYQRRVDLDETGLTYLGVIDSETQWIESFHAAGSYTTTLAPGAADPASLSELIATGRDGLDFQTYSDAFGLTRYVGEDRLTGETVTIDGVNLQRTAFRMDVYDEAGQLIWTIEGNEFIHPEWRTFLSGTRSFAEGGEVVAEDGTPVAFIFPGEPGFLGSVPRNGCAPMLSRAPDDGAAAPLWPERS
jgi:hypothetical protein